MMKDLIFVPILKNKANAEPLAISKCKDLFSSKIIPYIEVINEDINNRGYLKTKNAIGNLLHFEQYYRKDSSSLLDVIEKTKSNCNKSIISAIEIKNEEIKNEFINIHNFVKHIHNSGFLCSIRINTQIDIESIEKILKLLSNNDYLIIDIEENDYKSLAFFLKKVNSIKKECRIIVFSNERPINTTNKNLAFDAYNNSFNTSVIDSIKNNGFLEDGFGSYCAAKNNLTEIGAFKYPVYGAFVIYNFEHNNFFSLKTEEKDHISKVYSFLKSKLKESIDELKGDLFINTPISYEMICTFNISKKKGNASTYIAFSIVHYIEEIYNGMFTS